MRPNLTLVTLGVRDFHRSLQFYEKGLGWKPVRVPDNETVAFFPLNGIVLGIFMRDLLAKDANVPDEKTGFAGISLAFNAKSEAEVEEVMKEAEAAGAIIKKKPEKVFWGGYSGYFADPDGHLWEVAYNPYWKLMTDGRVALPSA